MRWWTKLGLTLMMGGGFLFSVIVWDIYSLLIIALAIFIGYLIIKFTPDDIK